MSTPEELHAVTAAAIAPAHNTTIACPACRHEFPVGLRALFEENVLRMRISMQDQHLLQVGTLGEIMVNLDKALKLQARDMGVKAQVLLLDVQVRPQEIAFDMKIIKTNKSKVPHA